MKRLMEEYIPITTTVVGDKKVVFASAPKQLMPGQGNRLHGETDEYVYVATTYVPNATDLTIPLQIPVVNSGNTIATYDVFPPNREDVMLLTDPDWKPKVREP